MSGGCKMAPACPATPKNNCPTDPEAERPQNYTEGVSSDETWENYGIRIKWTEPIVPGDFRLPLCEPLKLRLCVETKKELQVPPGDLTAWCWTCMKFKENPCGIWKEIKLHYNPKCTQWDDHGVTSYVFQNFVLPTSDENYRPAKVSTKADSAEQTACKKSPADTKTVMSSGSTTDSTVSARSKALHSSSVMPVSDLFNQFAVLTEQEQMYCYDTTHTKMTFNVKWKCIMIWANFFQIDNILNVEQKPSVGTQTTIYPTVHFTSNFVGDNGDLCKKPSSPVCGKPAPPACGGAASPPRRQPSNDYSDVCETQRQGYTTANEEDMQMLVML